MGSRGSQILPSCGLGGCSNNRSLQRKLGTSQSPTTLLFLKTKTKTLHKFLNNEAECILSNAEEAGRSEWASEHTHRAERRAQMVTGSASSASKFMAVDLIKILVAIILWKSCSVLIYRLSKSKQNSSKRNLWDNLQLQFRLGFLVVIYFIL